MNCCCCRRNRGYCVVIENKCNIWSIGNTKNDQDGKDIKVTRLIFVFLFFFLPVTFFKLNFK